MPELKEALSAHTTNTTSGFKEARLTKALSNLYKLMDHGTDAVSPMEFVHVMYHYK